MSDGVSLPQEAPVLLTVAPPSENVGNGSIFGGWIMSQCDLASGLAGKRLGGACVIKCIEQMTFHSALKPMEEFAVYAQVMRKGRTSFTLSLSGWAEPQDAPRQIISASFVMIAVDEEGRPRPLAAN